MKRPTTGLRPTVAPSFMVLLFVATGVQGIAPLENVEAPAIDQGILDAVERSGGGGGPVVLFADDMTDWTGQHYAQQGLTDYYGGTQSIGDGPDVWRNEPFRWGAAVMEGPEDAWQRNHGFWHFGEDAGSGPTYPLSAHAGVVTPMVSLRDVVALGANETVVANAGIPVIAGGPAVQPVTAPVDNQYQAIMPGGHLTLTASEHQATAALRILHAYDFQTLDATLIDGGRVEASYLHPVDGWTQWRGLAPSSATLRLGDEEITGRVVYPRAAASILEVVASQLGIPLGRDHVPIAVGFKEDPPSLHASIGVTRGQKVDIGLETDGPAAGTRDDTVRPWLYQGAIQSSQGRPNAAWQGFGGSSDGWVESVFDLSAFAGHPVRLRFVTATEGSELPERAGGGWRIANVEVHALAEPGVRVVGLLTPGDGALVAPGTPFTPTVVVANSARTPTQTNLRFSIDGPEESDFEGQRTILLGTGARGRGVVSLPASGVSDAPAGLYKISVHAMGAAASGGDAARSSVGITDDASFHFLIGPGSGWEVVGVDLVPDEDTERNRLVRRGDGLQLDVQLRNLASTPQTLTLTHAPGTPADIRPIILDTVGTQVDAPGEITPLQETVILPVSRDVSGSLGADQDIAEASWHWSGHDRAETVRIVFVDQDGQTVHDAGRLRVDAEDPPALVKDYANDWTFTDCQRHSVLGDRTGVLQCDAGVATSPAIEILESDLLESTTATIRLIHQGTYSVEALFRPEHAGATWAQVGSTQTTTGASWTATDIPIDLGDGPGDLSIVLTAPEGITSLLDDIAVVMSGRPVFQASFATDLAPQRRDILSATGDATWLAGQSTGNIDLDAPRTPVSTLAVILPAGGHIHVDAGRWVEDAVAAWDDPVALSDAARPHIAFRHWLDTGEGGLAKVQASTDGPEGPWSTLAAFHGTSQGLRTRSVSVPADGLVGHDAHLRFVFSSGPSGDVSGIALGWLVEDVRVEWQAPGGRQVLPLGPPGTMAGASMVDRIPQDSPTVQQQGGYVTLRFTDASQCAERGYRENTYHAGPALVTDTIDLTTAQSPLFTILHKGLFGKQQILDGWHETFFADLEYQVMDDDGQWPPTWVRATPHDPRSAVDVDLTDSGRLPLLGPDVYPFLFVRSDYPQAGDIPGPDKLHETSWDLTALTGEYVRFRLHAWMQVVPGGTTSHGLFTPSGVYCSSQMIWDVLRASVTERFSLVNTGVEGISISPDQRSTLVVLDPVRFGGSGQDPVLGTAGLATAEVRIKNHGTLDSQVRVQLLASSSDGATDLDVNYVDESGPNPKTALEDAGVVSLESGEEKALRFIVDPRPASPGAYTLRAEARVLDGVDSVAADNSMELPFGVLPFRALELDAVASSVTPLISTSDAPRSVHAVLRNNGNVREAGLTVEADLVRLEGLNSFDPTPLLTLPARSGVQVGQIAPNGGTAVVEWSLPEGALDGLLQQGQRYAFLVRFHPSDPYVGEGAAPDLTKDDFTESRTRLLPFVVEQLIVDTDFGQGGTSLLPDTFPADAPWTPETLVAGEPVGPDGPDVPEWQLVTGQQAASVLPGHTTGNVWLLPAYEGVEDIQHTLTSPVLPAHVVQESSRAILDLRYASTSGPQQVRVETRSVQGGIVGPWEPVDALRSTRVAVIVPPDFPRVTGSDLEDRFSPYPSADGPDDPAGHPPPPFVDGTAYPGHACKTGSGAHGYSNRCWWTPPYYDPRPGGDSTWWRVLDDTLLYMAAKHGVENVGLYTTLPQDVQSFLLPLRGSAGGFVYTLADSHGHDVEFPVGDVGRLGLTLENYGAVLLVGDGITDVVAHESVSLIRMTGHTQSGIVNQQPSALSQRHLDGVVDVLQSAKAKGLRVVAGIGPAPAAIAYSGIAEGVPLSVWQTPGIPKDLPQLGQLRCMTFSSADEGFSTDPIDVQPKDPCTKRIVVDGRAADVPDPDHPRNYLYFSNKDARSLAIRDIIASGRATLSATVGLGACSTPQGAHPLVALGTLCQRPTSLVDHVEDGMHFVTSPYPQDTSAWLDAVTVALGAADGALPAGDGSWVQLPSELALPVGGTFDRGLDGSDRFIGYPLQVRIVVQSEPGAGGHGAFGLDRSRLLGTPSESDMSVRFRVPSDGHVYGPGSPLDAQVDVTNRGVTDAPARTLRLDMAQDGAPHDSCIHPGKAVTISVPALPAGATTVLTAPSLLGGSFPQCNVEGVRTKFVFDAALQPPDSVPQNDVHRITAFGQRIIDVNIERLRLDPGYVAWDEVGPVMMTVDVVNKGTDTRSVLLTYEITHAVTRPCTLGTTDVYACHPLKDERAAGVIMDGEVVLQGLAPEELRTQQISLDGSALGPGVYRIRVHASIFSGSSVVQDHRDGWLHITHPDMLRSGGASFGSDLAGLPSSLQVWPAQEGSGYAGQPDSTGFAISRSGVPQGDPPTSQDGSYGPDAHAQNSGGQSLSHGWRVNQGDGWLGGTESIEWLRSTTPSMSPPTQQTYPGSTTPNAQGDGDFGDDHLIWDPYRGESTPLLSLASLQSPTLSFMARFQSTEHTALVVEAQFASRSCTSIQFVGIRCGWVWDSGWYPLRERELSTSPLSPSQATSYIVDAPSPGQPGSTTTRRLAPSNPLAGIQGIWGDASVGRSVASDGWQRLVYEVDPDKDPALSVRCFGVAALDSPGSPRALNDPCRFAASQGNQPQSRAGEQDGMDDPRDPIPRPIRFRFRAASFAGDEGVNTWRIDDLSLTGHELRFSGPGSTSRTLHDGTTTLIPMSLTNNGYVDDVVRLTWRHLEFDMPDVHVRFGFTPATTQSEQLQFELAAGQTRTVWAALEVGTGTGNPAESKGVPLPLFVEARSLRAPLMRDIFFMDIRFDVGSYADLALSGLAIGSDLGADAASASENTHVTVTALVRNIGRERVPAETVEVVLIEQFVDEDGQEVSRRVATDAAGNPARAFLPETNPFRSGADEVAIQLGWSPPQTGAYNLIGEVNLPVLGEQPVQLFPETDSSNNRLSRVVKVGPVTLPDLRISEAKIVDFRSGTAVDKVVVGHLYRIDATVENRGSASASNVDVGFRIGAAEFGTRNVPVFDGAPQTQSFSSSLWNATLPFDGTQAWEFGVDVFSPTPSATTLGKTLSWQLPVDFYRFTMHDLPAQATLEPAGALRLEFNITNQGNVPATPRMVTPDGSVSFFLEGASTIPVGGRDHVTLVVVPDNDIRPGDSLDGLVLGAIEDDRLRIPLPVEILVAPMQNISATALPLYAPPGPAELLLVLQNDGNILAHWTFNHTQAPLSAGPPWTFVQAAFNRTVVPLALSIHDGTPPGVRSTVVDLQVSQGGVDAIVQVPVKVHVESSPGLDVAMASASLSTGRGQVAELELTLENTGNVPLQVEYLHEVDFGSLEQNRSQQPVLIGPGGQTTIPVRLLPGPSAISLGRTDVSWGPVGGPYSLDTLEWQVTYESRGLQILDTDLFRVRPSPGQVTPVRVTVFNPLDVPQQAEILLLADGVLHSRDEAPVGAHQELQRTLHFRAPAGASADMQLIVRPAGSAFHPGQIGFHEVGDVVVHKVDASEGSSRLAPGPGALVLFALALALWRRRP